MLSMFPPKAKAKLMGQPAKQPEKEIKVLAEERRMKGRVCRLNKGFGFIEGAEDGRDYFFHWSEVDRFSKQFRNLVVGDEVDFQVAASPQGPRALNVKVISNAAPN